MSLRIEKASLLKNREPSATIDPWDGLVGAIIEEGAFFITSPNERFIPRPPLGDRPLLLRTDNRYGDDDPIQWPQPFNVHFPHYACIPLRAAHSSPSIMWWKPSRESFTSVKSSLLPITGLGKISLDILSEMDKHVDPLLLRVETYLCKTPSTRVPPFLGPLVQMLKHSLARLRGVAMEFSRVEFQVRDVQRSWLEVVAILDYVEIYRPRMDATEGTVFTSRPETAKTIGVFTSSLRVAQDHFQAGLPCWLIRPASEFSTQNILSVADPEYPHNIDLAPHVFRRRVLAKGRAGTDIKYGAIHREARDYMRYPDVFNINTTTSISTPSTSSTSLTPVAAASSSMSGPSLSQRRKGKANQGGQNKNRGSQSSTPGNEHGTGRNKFEPIDSPLMPLPIMSWQSALKAVDTDCSRLDRSHGLNPHDGKYLFPEPGIFVCVANELRRDRYFDTWSSTKDVCIFRVFKGSSAAAPLSGQQWRDFLIGNLNGTLKGPRNQQQQQLLRELFANCLEDMNLEIDDIMPPTDISPPPITASDAQKVLWELSELNFRFELLALDRRAYDLTTEDYNVQERQSMVTRCFPDTGSLIIMDLPHATQGLASLNWRERLPCLLRLRALMRDWKGLKPTPILLLDLDSLEMYKEEEVCVLEDAVARFYTQTFFNFFGRAAVIPTRLPLEIDMI